MSAGKLLILKHTFKNGTEKLLSLLVQDNRLIHVQSESDSNLGNIYVGKVKNISHNIGGCFVEIMPDNLCYLSLDEIKENSSALLVNRPWDGTIKAGDELVVQVVREAIKTKLPSVTTKISFSGKYVVLSAGQTHLGMSGKIKEERKKEILSFLQINNLVNDKKICNIDESLNISYGFVVRTNAGSLQDNEIILNEWKALEEKWCNLISYARTRTCYSCLYQEMPTYIKNLRDIYDVSYDEIITDCEDIYYNLKQHFDENYLTEHAALRLYNDDKITLSNLYGIPSKLEIALGSRVWLKSGGYLVIEPTEALTVIDVNSGKYESKKGTPDNSAYKINMEAAEEIAYQLKLRNLSGIIIVDFINMKKNDNEQLLRYLKQLCRRDSVPTDVVDITPLGLVEITRKKINKTLKEQLNL